MKSLFTNPEKTFLLIAFITGFVLCLLIPIGAGYDEDSTMARIWEISKGVLISNKLLSKGPNFPSVFYELSYRQKFVLTPVDLTFIKDNISKKIDWNNMINYETRSYYLPFLFFPEAFFMGLLGRFFDAPVLIIYYLCRFLCLIGYVFLTYLAIKTIPWGKWLLLTLALSPMAMTQASIVSADAMTNGISFLFIAYVFSIKNKNEIISKRELITLISLTAFLFSAKNNVAVLSLLLFLIPRQKFGSLQRLVRFTLIILALFGILVVGWNLIAFSQLHSVVKFEGVNAFEQILFTLKSPIKYIGIIISSIYGNLINNLREWIGVMGYRYWGYPFILYPLYILLLTICFIFTHTDQLNIKDRLIIIGTFVIGIGATVTPIYVVMNPVGAESIEGLDGRLIIALMPLLLFGLTFSGQLKINITLSKIASFGNVVILFMAIFSTFLAYYVNCGFSFYKTGLCYQPVFKNWEPNTRFSDPINSSTVFKEQFKIYCDRFSQLRLWTENKNPTASGSTTIKIFDNEDGTLISEKVIENRLIPDQNWLNIDTPLINKSSGRIFRFEISSNDVTNENSISFGLSVRDEFFDGVLFFNDKKEDYDILFQYGCDIGLGNLLRLNESQ